MTLFVESRLPDCSYPPAWLPAAACLTSIYRAGGRARAITLPPLTSTRRSVRCTGASTTLHWLQRSTNWAAADPEKGDTAAWKHASQPDAQCFIGNPQDSEKLLELAAQQAQQAQQAQRTDQFIVRQLEP